MVWYDVVGGGRGVGGGSGVGGDGTMTSTSACSVSPVRVLQTLRATIVPQRVLCGVPLDAERGSLRVGRCCGCNAP